MRTFYPVLLFGLFITACNSKKNDLFKRESLSSQIVKIDPKKDTAFKTQNGAIIRIPKDALQADGQSTIQLEIKEAYNISQIIMAGLTTQSDGNPLSSGGMIYINAVGENNVRITKPISVALPSSSLDPKMQLYKGKVDPADPDGKINWTDPKPLPNNPQINALTIGRKIFMNNCASCHALDKELTGPSLAHIVKRNAWMLHFPVSSFLHSGGVPDTSDYAITYGNLLYQYTQNNPSVLKRGIPYFTCLHNRYGKKPMPNFPNLTDDDLNNLYGYIENESEVKNLPIRDNGIARCIDSCRMFIETKTRLEEIKSGLEKDSTDMSDLSYSLPMTPPDTANESDKPYNFDSIPIIEKVNPVNHRSLYYQFTIETFGWYNVDMLLTEKNGLEKSKLAVRIQGSYLERFDIYLVVPSVKLFVQGGELNIGENVYGFYEKDGTIPLPQNAKAYILAMGESEDKIIFAKREFTTTRDQSIDITFQHVTKGYVSQQIQAISLDSITIKVNETKTSQELREVIRKIKKAEELKPKNCDCSCLLNARSDTTRAVLNMDYSPN